MRRISSNGVSNSESTCRVGTERSLVRAEWGRLGEVGVKVRSGDGLIRCRGRCEMT